MLNIKTIKSHINALSSLAKGENILLDVLKEVDAYMEENKNDFQLHLNLMKKVIELKQSKTIQAKVSKLIGVYIRYSKLHTRVRYNSREKAVELRQAETLKDFIGWVSFEAFYEKELEKADDGKKEKTHDEYKVQFSKYVSKMLDVGLTLDEMKALIK